MMGTSTQDIERQETTIADLVISARLGNRAAFDRLYARFRHDVFVTARRFLCRWEDAEDLTQMVFARAFTKIEQLRDPNRFLPWIRTATVRSCLSYRRRMQRLSAGGQERLDDLAISTETPLEALLRGEEHELVRTGIQKLERQDRELLDAYYFKGCTVVSIAAERHAPEGTIKRQLHDARNRLRKILARGNDKDIQS